MAEPASETGRVALQMGGPVFWFLRALGITLVVGALAVVIDSLRRPASHFAGKGARRWMWAGPQALLLVLLAAAWLITTIPAIAAGRFLVPLADFLALYLLLAAILQIAYLLAVVFPRRREPASPETGEGLPRE